MPTFISLLTNGYGKVINVPGIGIPIGIAIRASASLGLPNPTVLPGYITSKCILTAIGINERCNAQWVHSLNDFVYLYTFGDRIADMTVSGIAVTSPDCLPRARNAISGLETIYQLYRRQRVSFTGASMGVSIGTTMAFRVFLMDINIDFKDPETGLAVWRMDFKYPPQQTIVTTPTLLPVPQPAMAPAQGALDGAMQVAPALPLAAAIGP
jgi:hypothetical protein